MKEEQVLELIELAVKPLKDKISTLEKQNQQIKIQLAALSNSNQGDNFRLRSSSRQGQRGIKKEENREVRSPSLEKRNQKPVWNYGRVQKQQTVQYKSPPPVDKNKYRQVQAKIITRYDSKEKVNGKVFKNQAQAHSSNNQEEVKYLSFEKANPEAKKIIGGQKMIENPNLQEKKSSEPSMSDSEVKGASKINPQNQEQYLSENGSQILNGDIPVRANEVV